MSPFQDFTVNPKLELKIKSACGVMKENYTMISQHRPLLIFHF